MFRGFYHDVIYAKWRAYVCVYIEANAISIRNAQVCVYVFVSFKTVNTTLERKKWASEK